MNSAATDFSSHVSRKRVNDMPEEIRSMTKQELAAAFSELGEKSFRADQVYSWLHQKNASSFDEMTNLPLSLRERLTQGFSLYNCTIEKKLVSEYNNTVKYLFSLHDGEYVETVVMKYKYGHSICVSSQVGCRMNCAFCASALNGWSRDLSAGEILSQVYTVQKDLGIKATHVVMMGTGEPLDNYENAMRFISLITSPEGQNMSARHISVSTCGIVPKIYELAETKPQFTLSVSLHAPDDRTRRRLMPIDKKYSFDELMAACRYYTKITSRRISFEYAMISGVNDSDAAARLLSASLKGMLAHVNLIPVNAVKENDFVPSSDERISAFSSILSKNGITVTIRRKLGSDINASCGQLRRQTMSKEGQQ